MAEWSVQHDLERARELAAKIREVHRTRNWTNTAVTRDRGSIG